MDWQIKSLIVIVGLLLVGIFGFVYFYNSNKGDICSEQGIIFLTPEETIEHSQNLINKYNVMVVTPETKEIRGSSEKLNCDGFINPLQFIGIN